MSTSKDKVQLLYCTDCGKKVTPVVKMFNTKLCPDCGIILSGDNYIGSNKY